MVRLKRAQIQLHRKTGGTRSHRVSCGMYCREAAGITRLTAFSLSHAFPILRNETIPRDAIADHTSQVFERLRIEIRKAESMTPQNSADPKNDSAQSSVL